MRYGCFSLEPVEEAHAKAPVLCRQRLLKASVGPKGHRSPLCQAKIGASFAIRTRLYAVTVISAQKWLRATPL